MSLPLETPAGAECSGSFTIGSSVEYAYIFCNHSIGYQPISSQVQFRMLAITYKGTIT